jgi:hypothetical protein
MDPYSIAGASLLLQGVDSGHLQHSLQYWGDFLLPKARLEQI